MTVEDVKRLLERNSNDLAFVLGNGINLHYRNDGISWKDLLLDLWKNHSTRPLSSIPAGISFTEFYDALEIENAANRNFSSVLQKEVQLKMSDWRANSKQNTILDKIKAWEAPLLTTNFDKLIPKTMNLDFRKVLGSSFTDYYPWSNYYSDQDLDDPTKGFGVWYMNGMAKYHRSIKLGLSQYMGNVERARKMIHKMPENMGFQGKNQAYWPGFSTWLHILFNKSLVIVGLGLDETEVFLRWLLIERAKYFRRFPERKHTGYYIGKKSDKSEDGKKFFLNSVGFEYIELDEYVDVYNKIWQ
ncbi:SIR2 family protein [Saprospiraceae bacterium]|nr:SIR2 family protein [Saprospiraceae bacterium]